MDSPFVGQKVGYCKSFKSKLYLANVFAMHCGPGASPWCVQHCIQLTSLSLKFNRPSHSQDMVIKISILKIQGQGHVWGQSLKSRLGSNIQSTHIPPLIPMTELCQNLTLKIKSQSHSSKSHSRYNILLASLSFHVNRASDSWVTTFSKFELENQRSRSWVRSQFKVTKWV